jgi:hypothetical protein
MYYKNPLDKDGSCSKMGETAEDSFYKVLIKKGEVRRASVGENKKHIDFFLIVNGSEIKYDVKARKKINRGDLETTDSLIWLEILNVSGNDGWVRAKSGADFIAFEREKDFIILQRSLLMTLIELKCDLLKKVSNASQALYSAYTRYGRNDLLTIVKMSDLEAMEHEIWTK